jgi:hypothetical protein
MISEELNNYLDENGDLYLWYGDTENDEGYTTFLALNFTLAGAKKAIEDFHGESLTWTQGDSGEWIAILGNIYDRYSIIRTKVDP